MDTTFCKFIVFNIVFLTIFVFGSFRIYNDIMKYKEKDQVSFYSYINRGEIPNWHSLAIGLIFGIVFGFIDNFGLWMGLNVIEKYIPGGVLTKSGIGNIYSDFLGVVAGTSISILAKELIDYDDSDQPIWVNTIGIVIGCILGIIIGYLVTGKT